MKTILYITGFCAFLVMSAGLILPDQAAARGKLSGGIVHEVPDWFKEGFLDLAEDAAEAEENGKHVLLFMHVNGCPYCAKMFDEVFAGDKDYILQHFDSIALNIKGDREVTPPGGKPVSERVYATRLRVLYTPTIIFLDGKGKQVYRINGFWNKTMLRTAMEYVDSKSYKSMSLPAFAKAQVNAAKNKKVVYKFRPHAQLQKISDFSKIKKPLLVLFEDENCTACDKLHDRNLARPAVREVLKGFVFTRLDASSQTPIIDTDGDKTTAKAWAQKLKLTARPGMVLFDEGKERQRIDGELYGFHFQYALSYVSGKHYKIHDNWLKYLAVESEKLLQAGKNIDISDQPAPSR